jgi:predicted TIM-barrel fold metal-dependent hydrolase
MMASMKPAKHSVAVVVRAADGTFLVVRRPEDPDDPLAGLWGLPAITLREGEDEQAGVVRAGRAKLGVDLAAGRKIGEATADRGSHLLRLSDYEATVVAGTPSVPQDDTSMTQYVATMFTDDPTVLGEAAAKGSLCARVFLEATASAERDRVAAFRRRTGLDRLVDVHTHFMPDRLLAAVWAYFDARGPLLGRPWPIRYREQEERRLEVLRGFGVRAFTSMLYPHKPGMARSLNDWAAGFAAQTQDCLHTATFFAEPEAADDVRRAVSQGARVFKCHLQVGGFDPNDPLLDDVWGLLAEAGIPVVTHCGSGLVPGAHTGPGPIATLLARHPRLRLVIAHLGMPEYAEFLGLAERYDRVLLDTTMAFTAFVEATDPFPRAELPRLEALGDRVLLGTDYPNIPYSYADALEALERAGLSTGWLRAVCHDNAAALFALSTRHRALRCVPGFPVSPVASGVYGPNSRTFALARG